MNQMHPPRYPMAGCQVLVTGATGAVGRRLVSALIETGARVAILTRSAQKASDLGWTGSVVECRVGDLTIPGSLAGVTSGIDLVCHLASHVPPAGNPAIYDAPGHWSVTVEGTKALLLRSEADRVRRIVYVSSTKAMGDRVGAAGRPADESCRPDPECLYGRAKLAAEQQVRQFGERSGCHVSIVRLPMVYGLGATGNIVRLIDAIARRRFPPWPRVNNRRSAVHIDDAVAAMLLVACDPRAAGQTYLVTDGFPYSTRWLYEQILLGLGRQAPKWTVPFGLLQAAANAGTTLERWTGRAMPLSRVSLAKLAGDAWFSPDKIVQELGFRPTHRLATELALLIDRHRETG